MFYFVILGSLPAPRGLCACRRRFFVLKSDAPGIFEQVYCQFSQFEVPLVFFQKVGNLSKWLCQQDAHRFSVLGAGLNAPICFFPTRNLGEFLDFANLGLNVNLKNRGHPKP